MSRDRATDLDRRVRRAQQGDRRALESVVGALQDRLYNLAMRMLWHPEDAEDATQEILVKIVTRLGSFRGEAAFETWAWRVAANHLLTTRKRRMERPEMSFEDFAADLGRDPSDGDLSGYSDADQKLLVDEVKIGCTLGMLLCLDREHRLAYLLGEVFEVTSEEGAYITGVSAAAYRKRLSRARDRIRSFMSGTCGLVDPRNPCRCARRVEPAVARGRIEPGRWLFAGSGDAPDHPAARRALEEMEELQRSAAIFREQPSWSTPERVAGAVREVLDSGRFETLLDR